MHEAMATTLDTAIEQIKQIQHDGRVSGSIARPRWPMIVLNSPKGWTGPKVVDGLQVEGTFRAHQVPLSDPATHPEHLKLLENWLRSYRPEELKLNRCVLSTRTWLGASARGAKFLGIPSPTTAAPCESS